MNFELEKLLLDNGADIVRFVDISGLHVMQSRGFNKAILFCMVLSKRFVLDLYHGRKTERDEYLEKEQSVELLADSVALHIQNKGFGAHSQSEQNNLRNGFIECRYCDPNLQSGVSILPQKTIARLSGLGFVGKNNLLVTKKYGSALCMCSVLTDAPVRTDEYPLLDSKCGDCISCRDSCPAKAIYGNEWTKDGGREALVDVSKCCCALKCMVNCPWTLKYANA